MGLKQIGRKISTHNTSEDPENRVIYHERLYPSVWIWIISIFFSLTAFLIFVPINQKIGIIVTILLYALLATAWISTTPDIIITEHAVHAGKAVIDRRYLGVAAAFHKQEATRERGVDLKGNAYLLLRGWIDPVVKIEVTDADDPHPYWLLSTRYPEAVVRALTENTYASSHSVQ